MSTILTIHEENLALRQLLILKYQVYDVTIISDERFTTLKRSILDRYSTTAAAVTKLDAECRRINEGSYASVWQQLKSYADKSTTHELSFSPFSPQVPWLSFDLANDFLLSLAGSSKGGKATMAVAISALNFVLKQQHEIGKVMLAGKNPTLALLAHKDGMSGEAMRLAREKNNSYPLVRGQSPHTAHHDPHRGRIYRPLLEEELISINLWFLLGQISSLSLSQKRLNFLKKSLIDSVD